VPNQPGPILLFNDLCASTPLLTVRLLGLQNDNTDLHQLINPPTLSTTQQKQQEPSHNDDDDHPNNNNNIKAAWSWTTGTTFRRCVYLVSIPMGDIVKAQQQLHHKPPH
jgi:hypothetical protein